MTVGIAALCENRGDPRVVLVADRMVTTGYTNRIEYEHTNTKIEDLYADGNVVTMAVAAGSLSLADDVFLKLHNEFVSNPPETINEVADAARKQFQAMEQESFNNQKLKPLGLELDDFKDGEVNLEPKLQEVVLQDVYELKEEIEQNLSILIAGVDERGAHIYSVSRGDMARHNKTGYYTIGSGSQSSQLTFIRNRYDSDCSVQDGLLSAVEAKRRAEEAQGVGPRMDISVIGSSGAQVLEDDEIEQIRRLLKQIEEAEAVAREKTIGRSEYSYSYEP